jgi:hypothetical protein
LAASGRTSVRASLDRLDWPTAPSLAHPAGPQAQHPVVIENAPDDLRRRGKGVEVHPLDRLDGLGHSRRRCRLAVRLSRSCEQDQRKSRWEPPPDSDLIGIPLVVGMAVALLAIALAFVFLGGLGGLIVVGVVLIVALAISYRVVTSSEPRD